MPRSQIRRRSESLANGGGLESDGSDRFEACATHGDGRGVLREVRGRQATALRFPGPGIGRGGVAEEIDHLAAPSPATGPLDVQRSLDVVVDGFRVRAKSVQSREVIVVLRVLVRVLRGG